MATLIFKYCNPLWWTYAVTLKIPLSILWFIFCLPWNTVKGCYKAYKWTMRKFTSWYTRAIVLALAIWTAIPGTWLWTFYKLAHLTGYGEEAEFVVDTAVSLGSAMWTAGKFVYTLAVA